MKMNGLMWDEFRPLWTGLQEAGSQILVAGGYGLLLKQQWLGDNPQTANVIPLARWTNASPRATKDFDIVIGLDLLGSKESQKILAAKLLERDFKPVDPRWQFKKVIGQDQEILVDLHSELPKEGQPNLDMDKLRVKHKPSLGEDGIHGRQNPEAFGSELHPYSFEIDGINIKVPNPVTWGVMKLIAAHDRWKKSEEITREEKNRTEHRDQAIKHARDVLRIVALTTRDESDSTNKIIQTIRDTKSYSRCREIAKTFFSRDDGFGVLANRSLWLEDDLNTMRALVSRWYS